jgi:hypothetical protein
VRSIRPGFGFERRGAWLVADLVQITNRHCHPLQNDLFARCFGQIDKNSFLDPRPHNLSPCWNLEQNVAAIRTALLTFASLTVLAKVLLIAKNRSTC